MKTRTADSGARGCFPLALHTLIFATGCKSDAFEPALCYIASINNHQEQEQIIQNVSESNPTLVLIGISYDTPLKINGGNKRCLGWAVVLRVY